MNHEAIRLYESDVHDKNRFLHSGNDSSFSRFQFLKKKKIIMKKK